MPIEIDPIRNAEAARLATSESRDADWKNWGPYVSERAWGSVREDYSASGDAWTYFPHDHARSRAYRWNEDGLASFCNRYQNLCLGLAVWNEKDPYLKERLYGLNGHEGNHGEDVKEYYFYLDGTPTHSYMKMLYKYPQVEYPYEKLLAETAKLTRADREYELVNAIGDDLKAGRYFDVSVEYAKVDQVQEDVLPHATPAATKVLAILDNLEHVLAIELLCAAQAYDLQAGAPVLAARTDATRRQVRESVPPYADDRPLNDDFAAMLAVMQVAPRGRPEAPELG